jgi:CHAT domain-containing protein/tetratricopeptide (TPR) repeat protein
MPRRVASTVALLLPCLGALASSARLPAAGQTIDRPARLEAGRTIDRPLAGGEEHRYEIALTQGAYAGVTFAQRGIDVTVEVDAPGGTLVGHYDDEARVGHDERVDVVAVASGVYTLRVKSTYALATAGSYVLGPVEMRDATAEDRSRQSVRTMRAELGPNLSKAAQPQLERALALAEQAFGPDAIETARLQHELAWLHQSNREQKPAIPLYEAAAAASEKRLGADHPATARSWTGLAAAYGAQGQRAKALALAERALAVTEQALGPDHPQVALCLITLANLREDQGEIDAAIALERRALAIIETRTRDDGQLGTILNNLGTLLMDKEDYAQADDVLRRSLAIQEQTGELDARIAMTLQNLGIVARQRKDFAAAEAYYLRALQLRKKALGEMHPDVASNLNSLAVLYRAKGELPRSLETFFQALSILEKTAGPYNGTTITALGNIARTYALLGDVPHAAEFQRRVDTAVEGQFALNLAVGSERQKLLVAGGVSDRTDRTISLDAGTRFARPEITGLAALVILQRKGRVFDAMSDSLAAVKRRLDNAEDRALLDRLSAATAELARTALGSTPNLSGAERLAAISRLENEHEKLQSALSERSAAFRAQAAPVTLDAVRGALPADAALIELAVYRPFDPKVENSSAYGPERYAAYVLTREGTRGFDLGAAQTIDASVAALRQALGDPQRTDVAERAREVDAAVLQPLRDAIGPARHLLVSPDGALTLVPFEVLRDEQGRFAIERYRITYLGSGRDLLRMQSQHASRTRGVIVADPVFGEPAGETTRAQASPALVAKRSITSVDDLSRAYFAPLSGTALEARRIKSLFPDATVLARDQATKAAVLHLEAPHVLHIATHGFFIQDPQHKVANPLLRSGLALSGANLGTGTDGDAGHEGILTALEASNLDLWGTKLVTLSACDTGVGEVKNGEGVYGLRRAFFLAGAESLVMSLWPVNDYVTRELMTDYYSGLKRGLGRGDALRQAELAMLARKGRQHPFYWASFIQAGQWSPLGAR